MQSTLQVKLIAHTPDAEKLVAAAAKLCYSSVGMNDILEGLDEKNVESFLHMLGDIGHESPIEHANFSFAISGVSRALLAQLTRHRIASYSVRSQRYVSEGDFEYIIPPAIEESPELKEIFLEAMEQDQIYYNLLAKALKEIHTQKYIHEGENPKEAEKKAEKKANEDARFVLPNACETKIMLSMNARSLNNFFRLRTCQRAQWEIQALAIEMLKEVRVAAPAIFRKSGPPCYFEGKCPEGKMTCGKAKEVKDMFQNL